MKKTIIAALASLMLAGAMSAVSGAPLTSTATGTVVIVGDGASPIPTAPPANSAGDDRINHLD